MLTFEDWMKRVDSCLEAKVGLCSADLADICYRDIYDCGDTPAAAAAAALENEEF